MIDVNIVYDVDPKTDIKDNSFNKICENIFRDKNHEEANITLILSGDEKLRELKNTFFNFYYVYSRYLKRSPDVICIQFLTDSRLFF